MADAGFPVGSFVKRKATQKPGQVSGVTQDLVRVKQTDGSMFKVSIDQGFPVRRVLQKQSLRW